MDKTLRHGANDMFLANDADWVPSGENLTPDLTSDSWTATAGGGWSTAADWSSKAVPNASTTATIAATGTYTVTVTTPDVAASLLINDAGARVADTGTLTLGGALNITAGKFALESGGSLVGGTISTGSAGVFSVQGGLLDGSVYWGTLSVGASQSLSVVGGLTLEGANGSGAGQIALASGALLDVQDTEALNNGTLTFAGAGATLESGTNNGPQDTLTLGSGFTLLQSGRGKNYLTAGYYESGNNYQGDSITNNGTISVTGGTLTVNSTTYNNGIFTNVGIIEVSAGEFQLDADYVGGSLQAYTGETLDLTAGGTLAEAVSGAGTLELGSAYTLGSAGPSIAAITVDAAASLSGAGTITGAVTDNGTITGTSGTLSFLGTVANNGIADAASGLLSFKNALSGTGTLEIGSTGGLSLLAGAAAGQTVDFLSPSGALDLTHPASFLGSIAGFAGSDTIDLTNTASNGFTYTPGTNGGVLTVTEGSSKVATLNLEGNYTSASFSLTSDGHGGTSITFI